MEGAYSEGGTDNSKVHFSSDQVDHHNAEILVCPQGDDQMAVHLGFLQVRHVYEVRFDVKDALDEDLQADPLQNLHCRLVDVRPTEDGEGHALTIELKAYKEKLMKEELKLSEVKEGGRSLTLILQARVLGKGKGTPSLKAGIHCVGIEADEDSEESDWAGFQ